ncbi:hypothetical protein [Actinacidiphila reveromycinica]|uniref:hypothetical protein n=1 Tax=Actinacidiphila reveromycinica TaxID=659352 RepID=UPI001924CC2A|nr:hypothetical protein [Streptomyces sp. SN-593]
MEQLVIGRESAGRHDQSVTTCRVARAVLNMESLTQHSAVSGPVVYGFVRPVRVSPVRQDALVASLAEYCRTHEMHVSGAFTDRDASAGPVSAAFTRLLAVLVLPDIYGVTAPAISHLGPKATAAERGRRIEAVARAWSRPTPTWTQPLPPTGCRSDPPYPLNPHLLAQPPDGTDERDCHGKFRTRPAGRLLRPDRRPVHPG